MTFYSCTHSHIGANKLKEVILFCKLSKTACPSKACDNFLREPGADEPELE